MYAQLDGSGNQECEGFAEAAGWGKKLAKDMGGEVKAFYMTLGAYDLVLIVDMPNNDKLASFGLKLGSLGNVRSTTLRTYSEDDYRRIISGLS